MMADEGYHLRFKLELVSGSGRPDPRKNPKKGSGRKLLSLLFHLEL